MLICFQENFYISIGLSDEMGKLLNEPISVRHMW